MLAAQQVIAAAPTARLTSDDRIAREIYEKSRAAGEEGSRDPAALSMLSPVSGTSTIDNELVAHGFLSTGVVLTGNSQANSQFGHFKEQIMTDTKRNEGAPGTVDQRPRWEGPAENRPRGYLPAKDDPDVDRDAAGENNADPDRNSVSGIERGKGLG